MNQVEVLPDLRVNSPVRTEWSNRWETRAVDVTFRPYCATASVLAVSTTTIAVANQKGGVAKTTTSLSLGTALADEGLRVLLVDLDPQACLTYSTGVDPELLERSLHDVLLGRCEAGDVITKTGNLALLPATIDLAGAEVHLLTRTGREFALGRALRPVADEYDVILIDCPPSLGILTICGLTAADGVLIPMQCETLSHRGVGQLLETIEDVRSYTNDGLEVIGAVATMFDRRTNLGRQVRADVTERYGIEMLDPSIPKSVRAAEAPGRGPIDLRARAPLHRGAGLSGAGRQPHRTVVVSGSAGSGGRRLDPSGKRALFEAPIDVADDLLHGQDRSGKDALFSVGAPNVRNGSHHVQPVPGTHPGLADRPGPPRPPAVGLEPPAPPQPLDHLPGV